ncbi:initiation-specific alpha-1,6-mannosyltransferase [Clohesyomyces aquaticus]|uniref:Initiation-specific alpha-1,6-mannosyltransferase n=1 Tax=Clohesyomyces aquaticus TaxID=1231657 RepID=A0A1Y2A413_9PLEO|nr:initiation-specific alpha-1,6-mannosyltransferase [Clohesyomyces aquaticus]
MLTFRKALVIALAVLSFIFIFRSHHTSSQPAPIRNANDLPKPASLMKTKESQSAAKPEATQAANPDKTNAKWKDPAPSVKKPKTQIPMDELRKQPLRQQLEYQFPYDVESKFPAYIWQTWKYTPSQGEFDEIFREAEASWTIHHPSFVHEVITDQVAVHLIRHLYASVPEVLEAYHTLPLPVLKADFFRYLILLARGGIYSDIDTAALKSAADWIPADVPSKSYGMVIGIEADPDREDWHEWYSRRIQFCQWTIQSKPGHPVLVDVVANITQETLKRKAEGRLSKDHEGIIEFTGPGLWTDSIFSFFNNPDYFDLSSGKGNITWQQFTGMKSPKKVGDVIILPITSFSPGIKTMNAGDENDPMAFVKHNFEGTWKPEKLRHIGEVFN